MLAEEYILIDISLSAAVQAERLISAPYLNFSFRFLIGFCSD
jgi:hypothetical protein